jgi:hypothetical protein
MEALRQKVAMLVIFILDRTLNRSSLEGNEKKNCLELIVGLYRNLKKVQDQYTRRIEVRLNHLL